MEVKKANSGWLAFLISGIVAIGYGVLAIMFTEAFNDIFKAIMRISGICIAATGVIFLIAAIMRIRKKLPWGLILLEAVALITVGVISSIYATQALKILMILIGFWSVVLGVFMLFVMSRTKNLWNKGFYIVSAILSVVFGLILFGVLIMTHPFGFVKWLVALSGVIALVFGLIMMMFAFAIRRADKEVKVEVVESRIEESNL